MQLLILLNGKKETLIEHISNLYNVNEVDFEVIKLDEKALAKFKYVLKHINKIKYDNIFFGCIDIGMQRFRGFIHFYILLSKARSGAIIDENSTLDKFSASKFILRIFPSIILEAIASIFVVIYFYLKLFLSRWVLLKVKN